MEGDPCKAAGHGRFSADMEITISVCLQLLLLIFFGRFLHRGLRRLGQPQVFSQVLAGVLLGPTLWPRDSTFTTFFFPRDPEPVVAVIGVWGRRLFLFLVGLELDLTNLFFTRRAAFWLAYVTILPCLILASIILHPFYLLCGSGGNESTLFVFLAMFLSATAAPATIHMCADTPFVVAPLGRDAASAAILNDTTAFLVVSLIIPQSFNFQLAAYLQSLVITLFFLSISTYLFRSMIRLMNSTHPRRRALKLVETLWILLAISTIGACVSNLGFNHILAWLLMGVAFPRDGKARRTMLQQLAGPVHNLALPISFGYIGLLVDLRILEEWRMLLLVLMVVVTGALGRVGGSVAASRRLNMKISEGLILGLLLQMKGNFHFLLVDAAAYLRLWDTNTQTAVIVAVALSTLIAGPAVALILRNQEKSLISDFTLEAARPEADLRVLACVYTAGHIAPMLSLIEASRGAEASPLTACTLHLLVLSEKAAPARFYHQLSEDEHDNAGLGGEDGLRIIDAIDDFVRASGVPVAHHTTWAEFGEMHDHVHRALDRTRASFVVLPFHKRRRSDGVVEVTDAEQRWVNESVLREGLCTVGVLVDWNFAGKMRTPTEEATHNVVAVFFGGPDDREAAAYAARMVAHPAVSLTLMRFVAVGSGEMEGRPEMESAADEAFMADFCQRYVASGLVFYKEKYVRNSAEIVTALRNIDSLYSLYIVGKGEHGTLSTLTAGVSNWNEFPELGPVGDLMASDDFTKGSVLVIQQRRHSRRSKGADEERLESV